MMEIKETSKEIITILLASLILAIVISIKDKNLILYAFLSFMIIIIANTLTKKILGHMLEIKTKIKFWEWYHYGFRKDSHFKFPINMAWLPLLIAMFSKGFLWWFAILEFEVEPKTERVSRRHGLYRFTQVTEWHIAWIAIWGIITNITLAIIAYFLGFELFSKLSIYYAAWSIIPLSSLDGSKIFFGSRALWMTIATFTLLFLVWGIVIV